MKKNIFSIGCLLFTLVSFSQSSDWTKEDRNNIYDDYVNVLTKYKNCTKDQRESISLCCLDELTKKYSKKEYLAKIDIEIKRIQDAVINQCSINLGVDLTTNSINNNETNEVKTKFQKNDFDGIWMFENGTYTFHTDDGEFKHKSPAHNNEARGKWYLDGKTLVLEDTFTFLKWASVKYEIVSVSKDEIILINLNSKNICHLKKNK